MSETLENLYSETRKFPPPEALAADANVTASAYEDAASDRIGFWGQQARCRRRDKEGGPAPRVVHPAVREMVRRRPVEHRVQLRGPPRRGRPRRHGRDPLG